MRTIVLAFFLALMGCGEAVGADQTRGTDVLDAPLPADAVILPDAARLTILRQCSRSVPEPGEAGWQPNGADIAALEAELPAALNGRPEARDRDMTGAPSGWRRQYVGLIRGGRRLVYGNFFPRGPAENSSRFDWRAMPVVVCDGGPVFFGVEYDVAGGRITHLAFNGMA